MTQLLGGTARPWGWNVADGVEDAANVAVQWLLLNDNNNSNINNNNNNHNNNNINNNNNNK